MPWQTSSLPFLYEHPRTNAETLLELVIPDQCGGQVNTVQLRAHAHKMLANCSIISSVEGNCHAKRHLFHLTLPCFTVPRLIIGRQRISVFRFDIWMVNCFPPGRRTPPVAGSQFTGGALGSGYFGVGGLFDIMSL